MTLPDQHDPQRTSRMPGVPVVSSQSRHGMALLITLVVLVVMIASITGALEALHQTTMTASVASDDDRLQEQLRVGEGLAITWITKHGSSLVLPPHGGGVTVVNDHLTTSTGTASLSITIFDGLSGIPVHLAHLGSPLRFALPEVFLDVTIPTTTPATNQPSDLLETIELPNDIPRFPHVPPSLIHHWSGPEVPPLDLTPATDLLPPALPSLAEVISLHSKGEINLNTAPLALCEVVYQQLGLGPIDTLRTNREQGLFTATIPTPPRAPAVTQTTAPGTSPPPGHEGLALVASSDVWEVLIQASWNDRSRRWLVVLTGNPPDMRILQRHDADR